MGSADAGYIGMILTIERLGIHGRSRLTTYENVDYVLLCRGTLPHEPDCYRYLFQEMDSPETWRSWPVSAVNPCPS